MNTEGIVMNIPPTIPDISRPTPNVGFVGIMQIVLASMRIS